MKFKSLLSCFLFFSLSSAHADIQRATLNGSEVLQNLEGGVISGDGNFVFFLSSTDLYRRNLVTGRVRKIAADVTPSFYISRAGMKSSYDGNRIMFIRKESLFVKDIKADKEFDITMDRNPGFYDQDLSPDGTTFAVVHADFYIAVFTVENLVKIGHFNLFDLKSRYYPQIQYSSDGKSLIIGRLQTSTNSPDWIETNWVAVADLRTKKVNAKAFDDQGNGEVGLLLNCSGNESATTIVCFEFYDKGRLVAMNMKTGKWSILHTPNGDEVVREPMVSGDGSSVTFILRKKETAYASLFKYDVASGTSENLTLDYLTGAPIQAGIYNLSISRNGNTAYFFSSTDRLVPDGIQADRSGYIWRD